MQYYGQTHIRKQQEKCSIYSPSDYILDYIFRTAKALTFS